MLFHIAQDVQTGIGEADYSRVVRARRKNVASIPYAEMTLPGTRLASAVLVLSQRRSPGQDPRDIGASPTLQIKQWTNSIGMKFVRIEPGAFMMGTPENEPGRYPNENLHRVRLTGAYLLGAHEVTRGQFRAFVDATGFKTDGNGPSTMKLA